MTTLLDITNKRAELVSTINAYTSAVDGGIQANITSALATAKSKGDEYAKLVGAYKSENPGFDESTAFSNPTLMTVPVRDGIKYIMTHGEGKQAGLLLRVNTNGVANDYGSFNKVTINVIAGSSVEVEWGDGQSEIITEPKEHTYASTGSYDIVLRGTIKGFRSSILANMYQLADVMRWGGIIIEDFAQMFYNGKHVSISATDSPIIPPGASFRTMFYNATNFNSDISHWNVSNVTSIEGMFQLASNFNQPLNSWNVSNVTNMNSVFKQTNKFNQPLNSWNVSNVIDMGGMFINSKVFNQPLNNWDVSNVGIMNGMFSGASLFDQDLSIWTPAPGCYHSSFRTGSKLLLSDEPTW